MAVGIVALLAAILAVSFLLQGADQGVPTSVPTNSKSMADEFASADHIVEPGLPGPRPVIRHSIILATEPVDAQVTLDGAAVPDCPTPCPMKVLAGPHTVTFSKPGYRTAIRRIDAPSEIPLVELEPISGVLFLQSEPAGATVVVDGVEQPERTPVRLVLAPGTHRITLSHADREETIVVDTADGEVRHLSVPVR